MNELSLFAGAGGGILGGKLLGWRTRCAVEIDPYARRVLLARQRDGILEPFPIWDDVCTFDGKPWRGSIDVITGGFPCQDITGANSTGAGIDGERSGLWREFARIICEVGPRHVLVENSPALAFRGLDRVLGDLAGMGYDARWGVFTACSVGAPHPRSRMFIVAHPPGKWTGQLRRFKCPSKGTALGDLCWTDAEPPVERMAYGVAHRDDRLRCTGNGQVPAVVRLAWNILSQH